MTGLRESDNRQTRCEFTYFQHIHRCYLLLDPAIPRSSAEIVAAQAMCHLQSQRGNGNEIDVLDVCSGFDRGCMLAISVRSGIVIRACCS